MSTQLWKVSTVCGAFAGRAATSFWQLRNTWRAVGWLLEPRLLASASPFSLQTFPDSVRISDNEISRASTQVTPEIGIGRPAALHVERIVAGLDVAARSMDWPEDVRLVLQAFRDVIDGLVIPLRL